MILQNKVHGFFLSYDVPYFYWRKMSSHAPDTIIKNSILIFTILRKVFFFILVQIKVIYILYRRNHHFHFLDFSSGRTETFLLLSSLPLGPGISESGKEFTRKQHREWVSRTKLSLYPTEFSRFQEAPKEESIYSNVLVHITLAYLNGPPQ